MSSNVENVGCAHEKINLAFPKVLLQIYSLKLFGMLKHWNSGVLVEVSGPNIG